MSETTRRGIMTTATLGAAAAALATPAAAQPTSSSRGGKQDPREKYPKPPFQAQSQPWPGLASKMNPRPDHGEASYVGSGRLKGRKALITGGDSGMGRAAAIAFAREGADVAINYLPAEESDAREVIALIRSAGQKAVAIPGDLRDPTFCRRLVSEAVNQLGGLDIIVSNAGRQQSRASILEVSDEDFDATMKTNIYAPFYIIKAALPHLQPGSTIIATTSEQAYDPSPDLYDYAQTKAATMNFVKSLAKQLGPKGIRVNGVAPGPIWTPPAELRRARSSPSAPPHLWAGQGNLPNWRASMSDSLRTMGVTPQATSTAPAAVRGSRRAGRTMMPKLSLFAVSALAVVLPPMVASAQTAIPPAPKDFVAAAAQSDHYEIAAATVAKTQSHDPRVQAFAQDMIGAHTRTSEALSQAANAAGLAPPEPGMSSDQASLLASLQGLRGVDFDRAYAKQQVLAHTSALAVEQSFASSGAEPHLRQAAQQAVPTITNHLKMAEQLQGQLGQP